MRKKSRLAQFRKCLKIKNEDKKGEKKCSSPSRQMRLHPAVKVDQMIFGVSLGNFKQMVMGGGSKEMAMRRRATEAGNYEPH